MAALMIATVALLLAAAAQSRLPEALVR